MAALVSTPTAASALRLEESLFVAEMGHMARVSNLALLRLRNAAAKLC